jgi:hypothetical protein
MQRMRLKGMAAPGGTTTTPERFPSQLVSTAAAIAAAAFPMPTTTVRPLGTSGK